MNGDSNGDTRSGGLDVSGQSFSYETSQALPSLPSPQNANGIQHLQKVVPVSNHHPVSKFSAILKANAAAYASSSSQQNHTKARPSSPVFSSSSSEGKPAQEEDEELCNVCGDWQNPQTMLLCDECDRGFHMDCLVPPLSAVPEGNWFCPDCVLKKLPKPPKKPRPSPKPKPVVALPPPVDPSKTVEVIEYDDGQPCEVCRGWKDWNSMLLCDLCDRVYHMKCLKPPLTSIPESNWYCPVCDLTTEPDPSESKHSKRRKKADDDDEYVLNREELLAEGDDDIIFSDDEPIGRRKSHPGDTKGKTKPTSTKQSRPRSREDDSLSESSGGSWNSDEMLSDDDDPTRRRRKKKQSTANKSATKSSTATSKNVPSRKNKPSASTVLSSIAKLESQPVVGANGALKKQQLPFQEVVRPSEAPGIRMQPTLFRGKQVVNQNPNQDPSGGSNRNGSSSIAMPLCLSMSLPARRPQQVEEPPRHFQRPVVDDHSSYMFNPARSHHPPQASGSQTMGNIDENVVFGIDLATYMGHEWQQQQPQQQHQDPRSSQRDSFTLHPQMTMMNGFSNHHPQSFVSQPPMQHVIQHGPGSAGGLHNPHHHPQTNQPGATIIEPHPHHYGLYGHPQHFQDTGQTDIRNASRQISDSYPGQTRLPSPLPPPTAVHKEHSPSMHSQQQQQQQQQQQYNGGRQVDAMDIWSFFNGN